MNHYFLDIYVLYFPTSNGTAPQITQPLMEPNLEFPNL
jgi:hypothetical protein